MVRPGYQQTEVGEIPEDWDVISLGGYVDIASGESPSKFKFISSGIPYFKVEQLNNDPKYLISTPYHFESGKTVKSGSIIFPKRGASILLNKIRILKEDSFMDTNLMALTVSGDLWNEFLYYCLDYMGLDSVADTTSIPQINNKHIIPFKIAYPSDDEQKAIAKALSDVDELIVSLEKLIAKKRDIKTATMQQLLTGKKRLPGFGQVKGYKQTELGEIPEDWDLKAVYKIVDEQKSLFDDGDWIEAEHITNKGVRLVQTGNIGVGAFVEKDSKKYIYEESFYKLRCKEIQVGDILICRLAEPAGRACIFQGTGDEKVITSVDVTIYRPDPDRFSREYLNQYFSSSQWFNSVLEHVGGTTHKRISRGALGKLLVPLPTIEEQIGIGRILTDIEKELNQLEARLNKTKAIKQGMMQELLTGRTRLVEVGDIPGVAAC
jgi:type I restriction enzyme S subunit